MSDRLTPIRFEPDALYSVAAAETVLGSPDKQKRLRRLSGDLEWIRVGRNVFYTGAALNAFLAARARRSIAPGEAQALDGRKQ